MGRQPPQEIREPGMGLAPAADLDHLQVCHPLGQIGQVAAHQLEVAALGAMHGHPTAAGRPGRPAPDRAHGRAPRWHSALEPLDHWLLAPARNDRALGVHPDEANPLGVGADARRRAIPGFSHLTPPSLSIRVRWLS